MKTCTKKLAPHLLESLCKGYINAKNAYGKKVTIDELNIEIRYIPRTHKLFLGNDDLDNGSLKLASTKKNRPRYANAIDKLPKDIKKRFLDGDWDISEPVKPCKKREKIEL